MNAEQKTILSITIGLVYSIAWIGGFLVMRAQLGVWPGDPSWCVYYPGTCFCERVQPDQPIITPINAWSNMFYVGFGFLAIVLAYRASKQVLKPAAGDAAQPEIPNPMRAISPYSLCYAYVTITVGLMSWTMHAAWRNWGDSSMCIR